MGREQQFLARIAAELNAELLNLDKIYREKESFRKKYTVIDSYLVRALSSYIADFYGGVERILKIVGEEIDGGLPKSENWHKQLLTNAHIKVADRPPLIPDSTYTALLPYLAFRHVFRNAYGFELDRERIQALENNLPGLLDQFSKDIRHFCGWLTSQK